MDAPLAPRFAERELEPFRDPSGWRDAALWWTFGSVGLFGVSTYVGFVLSNFTPLLLLIQVFPVVLLVAFGVRVRRETAARHRIDMAHQAVKDERYEAAAEIAEQLCSDPAVGAHEEGPRCGFSASPDSTGGRSTTGSQRSSFSSQSYAKRTGPRSSVTHAGRFSWKSI